MGTEHKNLTPDQTLQLLLDAQEAAIAQGDAAAHQRIGQAIVGEMHWRNETIPEQAKSDSALSREGSSLAAAYTYQSAAYKSGDQERLQRANDALDAANKAFSAATLHSSQSRQVTSRHESK